jgi:phosphoglycerate kinase
MNAFKTIDQLNVTSQRILVRVDFNVPINAGVIGDTTRIAKTVPTLTELAGRGARVIVLSHLGRPNGQRSDDLSLQPIAKALSDILGKPVPFATDCVGAEAEQIIGAMQDGDIVVMENLRFHPGEEKNDAAFARQLSSLADVYVGDAFSCAHRAHASTEAIAHLMPSAAGRLMQAELEALTKALEIPQRPVAALVGGAKISTKLAVLGHLVAKVNALIIGGAMANTFLHAQGIDVGKSLCEHEMASQARDILEKARAAGCDVVLPVDAVVASAFATNVPTRTVDIDAVPADMMILDIGPKSVAELTGRLGDLRTLLWNGPLGAFEVHPFDAGTTAVACAAATRTQQGSLVTVAGGGDTVAALAHAEVIDKFTYVSNAGGAFLEWLEGRDLPGVAILRTAT